MSEISDRADRAKTEETAKRYEQRLYETTRDIVASVMSLPNPDKLTSAMLIDHSVNWARMTLARLHAYDPAVIERQRIADAMEASVKAWVDGDDHSRQAVMRFAEMIRKNEL